MTEIALNNVDDCSRVKNVAPVYLFPFYNNHITHVVSVDGVARYRKSGQRTRHTFSTFCRIPVTTPSTLAKSLIFHGQNVDGYPDYSRLHPDYGHHSYSEAP